MKSVASSSHRSEEKKSSSSSATHVAKNKKATKGAGPKNEDTFKPTRPITKVARGVTLTDGKKSTVLTPVDMDVLRGLDSEYVAAQRSALIGEQARRFWAFRSAVFSIIFIFCYMTAGILFFRSQTDWGLPDTILFAVYSATSAGYGHLEIPTTPLFQMVDTVYVLVGIASLAIMVAQVYQYLSLEAARAHDNRRAAELARRATSVSSSSDEDKQNRMGDSIWAIVDTCRLFFRETMLGCFMSVFLPLAFLALSGACTIGFIEGWSFVECIYFGVISLTTTGYGDYFPTKTASILICAVWLPCNIIFTSIYMGSVASWYLNFSTKGIQRIRNNMHSDIVQKQAFDRSISTPGIALEKVDIEYGLDNDSDEIIENTYTDQSSTVQNVTKSSNSSEADSIGYKDSDEDVASPTVVFENLTSTLATMADVIRTVHARAGEDLLQVDADMQEIEDESTPPDSQLVHVSKQPGFKLRVLVQQRFAAIIAFDLVGGDHHVDVQDSFIVVRIGRWKQVVSKWLIPSGAWKTFRAAALDAMMLVGERNLIQQGPYALYELSPEEFHSIFSALVAAMGDAETLQGWLNSTENLAIEHDFFGYNIAEATVSKKPRKLRVQEEGVSMPKSQGTAFHKN
mmetsp:Transcript_9358/g.18890  ORF Transcript_9358/g.18890 Transcript_9358/m.18890 type:complete len:627 (-) Transcript_9358:86-1966(-)